MPPRSPSGRQPWTKNRAVTYLSLPPLPPPDTNRPVTFCVPDHPDWRAALYGSISLMGSWLAWKRDDEHTGKEVALIWREIIHSAQIAAERGEPSECMDWCQIIAGCIADDGATQEALNNHLIDQLSNNQEIIKLVAAAAGGPGLPLNPGLLGRNLFNCTNTSVTFSQVTRFVDYLKEGIDDFFEILEAGGNTEERAILLGEAIPAISNLPIGTVYEFIDKFQEDIYEGFAAAYTVTGEENYRDTLRCALLCLMSDDCAMSISKARDFFANRVGAAVQGSELIRKLIEFFILGEFTGSLVADFAFFAVLTIWEATSQILGKTGISHVEIQMKIAARTPDDTWIDLCPECGELPPECDITYDFSQGKLGWNGSDYNTDFSNGGWGANQYGNMSVKSPTLPFAVKTVVVTWSTGQHGFFTMGAHRTADYSDPAIPFVHFEGNDFYSAEAQPRFQPGAKVHLLAGINNSTARLVKVRLIGDC